MIACFDVHYKENYAQAAAVLFQEWDDDQPFKVYVVQTPLAGEYEPGQFYKRELPALLYLINRIAEPLRFILLDSYVLLGKDRPGLGHYLYEALERTIPVIGLAKSHFRAAESIEAAVLRGKSTKPLFVTTIGCDLEWAAEQVRLMAGPYRLPTLVQQADKLSKEGSPGPGFSIQDWNVEG